MCGIFGIFAPGTQHDQIRCQLYQGVAQLEHRGPDGWGAYFTNGLGLGHTRLSIIDPKEGHQPMVSDRAVIVYNGEIYNHRELRDELEAQGVKFNTSCDTEVILRLYEQNGHDFLSRLNGQFAFLLWDKVDKTLFVARDRLGMRPLYIFKYEGSVYFSSEMKAFDVLFPGEREFSPRSLTDHGLLWNTLSNETVYKDIHSVCSGSYEIYRDGQLIKQSRYYDIGQSDGLDAGSIGFDQAVDKFKDLLNKSVEFRLRSDVPVGGYLSGGIDSTVTANLIKQQMDERFRTFSVEFSDQQYDESSFQRLVSGQLGSEHHSVHVHSEMIANNFLDSIYHGERPVFRTAPVPMYLLSEHVRANDIKVVITGEGADEILFGYDSFKELKILEQWKSSGSSSEVNDAISNLYPHLSHYSDPKQFGLIKMYYEGFLDSFDNGLVGLNIRVNNNKALCGFFNKDWGVDFENISLLERLEADLPKNFTDWSLLQRNSYLEIKTLLQGYLLSSQGDRMALGHSVEGRYPFLDHNLIDFVFALPDEYKLKGFSEKHLLKQAFSNQIPQAIIDRPKRPYMAPDIASFYQNDQLIDFAADLLGNEKIKAYGCFDETMVARFLRKFRRGVPDQVGYRDNMIFTFLLSAQSCMHWIKNPKLKKLNQNDCTVEIFDYQ